MIFTFNTNLAKDYRSNTQRIRVLTEDWVSCNMYCPICGRPVLHHYEANRPVADFFCDDCHSDFELKSKEGKELQSDHKIVDGAYETMIRRITSLQNPNFFFLTYQNFVVNNFVLIPNHFFIPGIIEKREPLSDHAKRAGWIGCNIDLHNIPESGKIFIIRNGQEIDHQQVIACYQKTEALKTDNLDSRGWIMDVLNCIDRIASKDFTLSQIYAFEQELKIKHPDNNFIKDKIRQQLQLLRDKGLLEFTSRGNYRKP